MSSNELRTFALAVALRHEVRSYAVEILHLAKLEVTEKRIADTIAMDDHLDRLNAIAVALEADSGTLEANVNFITEQIIPDPIKTLGKKKGTLFKQAMIEIRNLGV